MRNWDKSTTSTTMAAAAKKRMRMYSVHVNNKITRPKRKVHHFVAFICLVPCFHVYRIYYVRASVSVSVRVCSSFAAK